MDVLWLYKFEFCAALTPFTQEHKNSRTGVHLTHTQSTGASWLAHRES